MDRTLVPNDVALAPVPDTSFVLAALGTVDIFEASHTVQLNSTCFLAMVASGTVKHSACVALFRGISGFTRTYDGSGPFPFHWHVKRYFLELYLHGHVRVSIFLLLPVFEGFDILKNFGAHSGLLHEDGEEDVFLFLALHGDMCLDAGLVSSDSKFGEPP